MAIRKTSIFGPTTFVEMLGRRVSPTFVSISGLVAASSFVHIRTSGLDDPLPRPEPPPTYPGGDPPIEYPVLPPSGPAGPG